MDIQILAHQFYDYSKYIKGFSAQTIRRYRQMINFYCKFANITKLEEVTDKNIREFFVFGRTVRNWSPKTFLLFTFSLKVFFRWCIKEGYMTNNPAEGLEVPKIEKRLPVKLTKQDALKLLEVVYNYPYDWKYLRYRNHAIFATFLFAGLRKKELLSLKLTDVDIDNLSIFVRQGKGAKDRVVPMSYTLAQILKKYLEERRRLKKTCPEFFTSLNRDMGFTDMGMREMIRKIRKTSKIPFTAHKLRHSFATLMLEGGCDIYSLSKMMGHSDIKTTTIYLFASAEHLRSQITKHPLNSLS